MSFGDFNLHRSFRPDQFEAEIKKPFHPRRSDVHGGVVDELLRARAVSVQHAFHGHDSPERYFRTLSRVEHHVHALPVHENPVEEMVHIRRRRTIGDV